MKILVYNVERGAAGPRREAVERAIVGLAPDVAVILEAVGWRTRKVGERILRGLGGGEAFYCAARTGFDLAILSCLPCRNPLRHPELELFHGLLSVDVEVAPGFWTRVHAAHLAPSREEARLGELRAILGAIHDGDGVGPGAIGRLIAGDLNAVRPDDTIGGVPASEIPSGEGPPWRQDKLPPRALEVLLGGGWLDLFRECNPSDPGYTFPAATPIVRYDYVFGNAELRERVARVEVIRDGEVPALSDHLPLLVTLR